MHRYKLGVIGLGAIGLPVAQNLASQLEIQVWNRSAAKYGEIKSENIAVAHDLSSFDSQVIVTVLPNSQEVIEVLNSGLLETLKQDDLLVVMGTVAPESMLVIDEMLATKGARAIDAPVSGGDIGAQEARLSIMVGGGAADFERLLPYFQMIGSTTKHVGALGSAQGLKACNQIIVGGNLVAIAEALSLSRKFGISDSDFFEVISQGLAGSNTLTTKWPKLAASDFSGGGKSSFMRSLLLNMFLAQKFALPPMEARFSTFVRFPITKGSLHFD